MWLGRLFRFFKKKEEKPIERYRLGWHPDSGMKTIKIPICDEKDHDWKWDEYSPPWERVFVCTKCGLKEDGYGEQW